MTLEQYLWRYHEDELLTLVLMVMLSKFQPTCLADWWEAVLDSDNPWIDISTNKISSLTLIDMAMEASPATRAGWPKKVRIAADALRAAANHHDSMWTGFNSRQPEIDELVEALEALRDATNVVNVATAWADTLIAKHKGEA